MSDTADTTATPGADAKENTINNSANTEMAPDEPQGGGKGAVIPGIAGAVGAVGGLYATPYIMNREGARKTRTEAIGEARTKVTDAKKEYDKKHAEAIAELTGEGKPNAAENKNLFDSYSAKKSAHTAAEEAHLEAKGTIWVTEVAKLSPEMHGKAIIEGAEGQIKFLKSLPASEARNFAIEEANTVIATFKEAMGKPDFKDTENVIDATFSKVYEKIGKLSSPADLEAFMNEHGTKMYLADLDANLKVNDPAIKAIAEKIEADGTVKATKAALETATTQFTEAESKWKPLLEKQAGAAKSAVEGAEKKLSALTTTERILAGEGMWVKPFKLIKSGSMGTRTAIVAAAVGLGAMAYAGVRAIMPARQGGSFAEREDARKLAPADAQRSPA